MSHRSSKLSTEHQQLYYRAIRYQDDGTRGAQTPAGIRQTLNVKYVVALKNGDYVGRSGKADALKLAIQQARPAPPAQPRATPHACALT
jgi:hypothetical protein